MDNSELIREGFICPECREDLTSFSLLEAHFELKHSQKLINDDKTTNNSLSSVIAKAKTYLLSSSSTNNDSNTQQISNEQTNQQQAATVTTYNEQSPSVYNVPQEDGVFRSYTKEFKEHRDKTVGRYVIQTNKLLIILDKLIANETIKDENKRKAFEMTIVKWVPDGDVNLCPTCARSFGLIHRKHHCRLCGAIMCNKCSQFLSTAAAKQLTDPTLFMKDSVELKFKRSNSDTSINSHQIDNDTNNNNNQKDVYIRLCVDCSRLLNKKYQSMKDKSSKSKIFTLYDDFHACIHESKNLYPIFTKMAESLSSGETVYNLKSAEDMRFKLLQLYQKIDLLSNSILNFGLQKTQSNENSQPVLISTVSKDQIKLQKNIRLYAINYLKEYSFQLSALPTKDEYDKLVEQKRQYLMEELQRETLEKLKLYEIESKRQFKSSTSASSNSDTRNTHINNSDGWVPTTINENKNLTNSIDDIDDPIKVQIKQVENYLNEARKQGRLEESKILEENLNELKKAIASN